ncbi:2151_t:CDS:1 [Ambispora leptoticha]|uniref:2151_t:CDS:1 n=1 Tax=Ambispora leptoticha TaxID=144679 RepID=A0A9N8V3K9_9GLOM|nr:2151_t:CDS:1 [Ambispora leptoticha]
MFRWKHVIPLAERKGLKTFLTRDSNVLPLSFIPFSWFSPSTHTKITFDNLTRQLTFFVQPHTNKFITNSTTITRHHYSKFHSIFVSKPKTETTIRWPLTLSRRQNLFASFRDYLFLERRYPHSKASSTSTRIENAGEKLSMFSRLKLLTRQYGASAVVVYFAISAIDLAATLILIQSGGGERVKKVEDWITETFGINTRHLHVEKDHNPTTPTARTIPGQEDTTVMVTKNDATTTNMHSNDNSKHKAQQTPSWMSTLAIAYLIHKLLLPLRLGVTAAVTPPLVRKLQSMGWNIGKKT